MTSPETQETTTSYSHDVFINYHKSDFPYAEKLYLDLRAASLNPWIDKENLLGGQTRNTEIENAIRKSRYFVAILSSGSINATGEAQVQIKRGLSIRDEFPNSKIYFIPTRLDEFDIPFEYKHIEFVDLFPVWEKGLKKILKSMGVDQHQIKLVIQHQRTLSPFVSSPGTFKGEKQFFVGRHDYIDKIIKDKLRDLGCKVVIVGPGGSGKSQLAFKAIHQYVNDGIFDFVIPIYFDEGLLSFDKFLLQIAEIFGLKADDFVWNTLEQRKGILRGLLSNKKNPLIYLDNFETVSLILNENTGLENEESIQNATQITDFLNNIVPSNNTSILVTSREKRNNLSEEYSIDLEGLNLEDSLKLFNAFVRPIFKDPKGQSRVKIEKILEKTGGHPLSIEIIAKNLRGLHELESISKNLGSREDPTQADKRFKTLQACFDYTINRLDNKLQELIPKLTLFKSPFPISATVEIFGITENEILDLYDRSLLKLVNSDELYGKVQDPDYWLYNFHPAIIGYVEDKMQKNGPSLRSLEMEYGEKFSIYYYNLLESTYDSIGKENHITSLARFNIIRQGDTNDFERAIELTIKKQQGAYILRYLGLIVKTLGMLSKAFEYYTRSININKEIDNRAEMAIDYSNIGIVLRDMGNYPEALDYHKKALEIDEDLNNRVGMAMDYRALGSVQLYRTIHKNSGEALDYYIKALKIHESMNDRVEMANDYWGIGNALDDMGNYQQALDYHNKALEINESLDDRVRMAGNYFNLGCVQLNLKNFGEALDYYIKALKIHESMNDRVETARNHEGIGIALKGLNKRKEALESVEKGLNVLLEFEKETGYHHPLTEKLKETKESLEDGST